VIFRAQQLDLIYAQSGMLYHLLPDAPQYTYDPRKNTRPHANGIVFASNVKSTDSVTNHLKELSLSQSAGEPTSSMSSIPTQSEDVHSVQSSANPNGNQQPGGNKKKGRNNRKGGKNGNKPKENNNNEEMGSNDGEEKREKCKVNFPYKIFTDDHLTHLCPKLAEATRLLAQSPTLLMNTFPHNQHLASSSSNVKNAAGGGQNQQSHDGDRLCINMVDAKFNVATRFQDYSSKQAIPGLEYPPRTSKTTLQIEKPKPPPHIMKGVLKRSTHNPNARAAQNYSIVEDLGQIICAMSAWRYSRCVHHIGVPYSLL
jgi:hypothetical protein